MIQIRGLAFRYPGSQFELSIPALEFGQGQKIAIQGASGCGKTTMLNLIAGIQVPASGSVEVLGQDVPSLSETNRRKFRIQNLGMIFQEFELVDYLTARDNILLPFKLNQSTLHSSEQKSRLRRLAECTGLEDKLNRFPSQLSRGEQQRVAICRALVSNPQVLLADEPTGNLDPVTTEVILNLLFEQCDQENVGMLFVTHDHSLLSRFDHVVDFAALRTQVTETN